MILFAISKLNSSEWQRVSFESRCALIEDYYELKKKPNILIYKKFFEKSDVGIFVAYQKFNNVNYNLFSSSNGITGFLTHFPFGVNSIYTSDNQLDPSDLINRISFDHQLIGLLNPPIGVVRIDELNQSVEFWNDALGLAKSFLLKNKRGVTLSNRPIAAHFLSLTPPKPDDLGWASEQLLGWYSNESTPYEDTNRLSGGSYIKFDSQELIKSNTNLAAKLFLETPKISLGECFEKFSSEYNLFFKPHEIDVALSGGRDSRASAAIAAHFFSDRAQFRTNEPPALEGIIARSLIENLSFFSRFNQERNRAYDLNGRMLWKANKPINSNVPFEEKFEKWVRFYEGIASSGSLMNNPPKNKYFSDNESLFTSISGAAGESAKAYYWSPRMVSGAYASSLKNFREDILGTHISKRIKTHPLTQLARQDFIVDDLRDYLNKSIYATQKIATSFGIHGYRFLDYWWLVNRFGAGGGEAYAGVSTIMPFMAIDFMKSALQMNPMQRAQCKMLNDIVLLFNNEWKDVKYFDELQNKVSPDLIRYYRGANLLWSGEMRDFFFDIVNYSPALSYPYKRNEIIKNFIVGDIPFADQAALNKKGLGLVHRHYFYNICLELTDLINKAK